MNYQEASFQFKTAMITGVTSSIITAIAIVLYQITKESDTTHKLFSYVLIIFPVYLIFYLIAYLTFRWDWRVFLKQSIKRD